MAIFTGSGTAVCTPFNEDGTFDYVAYEKLIRFQVGNGTDAIVSCGTTGEAPTLEDDEHIAVVRAAVEITKKAAAGGRKIPVIAGAGGNNTQHCLNLGNELIKTGADALMFATPYYNKTTQRGLVAHFSKLAAELSVPIIMYNIPGRTGLNMKPETMRELCRIENIAAVKEASGDIVQIAEIIERCGDKLDLYAGNDDYIVPVLSLGGKGVISTAANIVPAQVHEMVFKYLNGDTKGAAAMQLDMLGLVRALFSEVNPIPVKAALNAMGFRVGACRMPLTSMDDILFTRLKKAMEDYGLRSE
jgi:4-hydroxy-tetrahydrodipicolinate synthase